jgi:uncharacterized protein
MIMMQDIQSFVDRIVVHFQPEQVILFGSFARGDPTPDSDVDLLVVLHFQGKNWRMASEIRKVARAPFPMDLLVRTPGQMRQRLASGDTFLQEITQQGKLLYEA